MKSTTINQYNPIKDRWNCKKGCSQMGGSPFTDFKIL